MKHLEKIRLDYKPLARAAARRVRRGADFGPRLWWLAAALPLAAAAAFALNQGIDNPASRASLANTADNKTAVSMTRLALPLPQVQQADEPALPATPDYKTITLTIDAGDTLGALFNAHDLAYSDLYALMQLDLTQTLKSLVPGDTIRIQTSADGDVQALAMQINDFEELRVSRALDGTFSAEIAKLPLRTHVSIAHGEIESSLFLAGLNAGLSDNLIMNLAHIYSWDIDFVHDLRAGDNFTIIYEELYRDGEKIADGDILAAEFVNQGETFRAVRYTNPAGITEYYTPEGLSVRKALLRNVVDFTRISSNFSLGRKHPILNTVRKHEGTDYAAPSGTPIKSAGDGKVVFAGRKGGYGNVLVIKHGGGFSTLYAHTRGFARGIHVGEHVEQGEVVAYVGMSGLATGPHLHYEVRLNGVHRDPRKVNLPEADPVDPLYKADFLAETRPLLKQLDLSNDHQQPMLASSNK
ncbi:MAG TPA: M23 family metallopeptidase [Gammaproteobacteria bacterium]|nr:M23 family metallopeptidase [Gammaproteobacteria bacterium]